MVSLGPERAAQPLGDGDEQLVAGGVAGAVVDGLEVVEVHEEDGDRAAAAVGAGQRVVEPVGEQRAVGQAGERVVEGVVLRAAPRAASAR